MLRIGQVETTATQDGKYTDGNVAGGVAATRLRAAAFNAVQEELCNIVESSGMALNVNDMNQVLTALKKMMLSRSNPFADIKSDGENAIALARGNLGFDLMGIGLANNALLSTFDWQQVDFTTGARYLVSSSTWTNAPSGVNYPAGTQVFISVDGITSAGTVIELTLIANQANDANYRIYKVRIANAKGSRTFTVRQIFTSADTVSIANGGTGATTIANAWANLNLNFDSIKSTTGKQVLPSGIIRQWQQVTLGSGGTCTFPTAYPNALLNFSVIHGPGATAPILPSVSVANRSGLQILHNGATNIFTVITEGY